MIFAYIALTAILAGAGGAYLVYRFYAPKLKETLRLSLMESANLWENDTYDWLVRAFDGNVRTMASAVDSKVVEAEVKIRQLLYERMRVMVAEAHGNLKEYVLAETAIATNELKSTLDEQVLNQVLAVLAMKETEPKLDGVSADQPTEETEPEATRNKTGIAWNW